MYNVIKITDLDSTNNYILSLQESELFKEGLVVVSDFQQKGRGQRGNFWISQKCKNITLSVLIEPNILIERQFDLIKITSLSIKDFLLSLGIKSHIKWPNDILVDKQKISGILTDNIISRNMITYSIIGIGLNVNQIVFEDYIPKATSLSLQLNRNFILEEIQENLLNSIKNRLNAYRTGLDMKEEYLNSLFQKDKITVFETKLQRFNGIIRGVTERGELIIETESSFKRFSLKDIKMLF